MEALTKNTDFVILVYETMLQWSMVWFSAYFMKSCQWFCGVYSLKIGCESSIDTLHGQSHLFWDCGIFFGPFSPHSPSIFGHNVQMFSCSACRLLPELPTQENAGSLWEPSIDRKIYQSGVCLPSYSLCVETTTGVANQLLSRLPSIWTRPCCQRRTTWRTHAASDFFVERICQFNRFAWDGVKEGRVNDLPSNVVFMQTRSLMPGMAIFSARRLKLDVIQSYQACRLQKVLCCMMIGLQLTLLCVSEAK